MTGDGSPTEDVPIPRRLPLRARRHVAIVVACAVIAGAVRAHPVSAQTTDDLQVWASVATQGAVHGPYRVSAELHGRWHDNAQLYERTVVRLQGGRALTRHLTAWFGFEETWPFAGRTVEEARIWQQVIFVQPAGAWALSHRARIEERFVEGADRMVPRFRYSLRATRPLQTEGPWGAVLGAEVFFQLRDAYREEQFYPTGLDRDRVQAGISRRLTHALAIESSYLLQFINAPTPLPNRREHLLQLQVVHRF